MNTTRHEQMWNSLRDPEFRKQLIDEHINVGIAFQIRGLRNRQELRQGDLAEQLGVKQPLVSAWENPNYGNYSLNTLKDMAKAFDVGLLVRFVPFSTLVNWSLNVTPNVIAPPNFDEEKRLAVILPPSDISPIVDTKDTDVYDLKLEEPVSSKPALSIPSTV
ncbi:helix-turn-helix transcriptional regulator [candidate division WOR-3 bacterium]|nr:helix-turn-helix transcriptional regulator [candidate division WOR-3 bacterium]